MAACELALNRRDYRQIIDLVDLYVNRLHKLGMRTFVPDGLYFKGRALIAKSEKEEAFRVLTEAGREAEAIGSQRSLWPVLVSLSQLEAERGNSHLAADLRRQAQNILQYIADHAGNPELGTSFLALPPIRSVFE